MTSLLVSVLMLLLVMYVVHLIVAEMTLPENVKKIVYLIVGVVFLLSLLKQLGLNP